LVKSTPNGPLADLTKVPSWTNHFGLGILTKFFGGLLGWFLLLDFFIALFINQQYFDSNYI